MGKPKKKPVADQVPADQAARVATVYRLETVGLSCIRPSPTNPRKHFDEAKLAELTESIRGSGVLQPLLLRPHPELAGEFECVAGERRRRAATAAGVEEVPANIREMSDREVLEAQLVENSQRADAHALEEADAIAHLHEAPHHVPVEEIAAKLGKSIAYVYSRLRLCALGEAARTAFVDGVLTNSTALLVGRLSNPALQAKLVGELRQQAKLHEAPPSIQDVQTTLGRGFLLRLAQAPFDIADASLTEAGACTTCPKRSGNQGVLFAEADVAEDACTDPDCHKEKAAAAWTKRAAKAKSAGQRVLSPDEAKKAIPYAGYVNPEYVKLDDTCHADPESRTYGELLEKAPKKDVAKATTIALNPHTDRPVDLIPRAAVGKLLEKAGHTFDRDEDDAPAAKAREEKRQKLRTLRELVTERSKAEARRLAAAGELGRGFWLALIELQAELDDEAIDLIRREDATLPPADDLDERDVTAVLDATQLLESELRGIFVETMIGYRAPGTAFVRLGVDVSALERDARAELGLGEAPDPLTVACPAYNCHAAKGTACLGGTTHPQRADAAELAQGDGS